MSYQPTDIELKQLVDRWISQWNEPDSAQRHRIIREVWTEDGFQVMVRPPQVIREAAAQYRVPYPAVEIRGYDAIFARVSRAYEEYVAPGEYVFEQDGETVRHAGAAVAVTWVMRSCADGSVAGSGLEVLTFGDDGRVHADYEFVA